MPVKMFFLSFKEIIYACTQVRGQVGQLLPVRKHQSHIYHGKSVQLLRWPQDKAQVSEGRKGWFTHTHNDCSHAPTRLWKSHFHLSHKKP